MRLIDADELMEHVWRDKLDSRELIAKMIDTAPTVKETTAKEYRQRMIQAFHDADCDELIAVCVFPEEKEFEHLEWLLKNYKKIIAEMMCEDVISRRKVIDTRALPSVTLQQRTGHWILLDECSNSGYYCSECQKKVVKEGWSNTVKKINYCPNCGVRMEAVEK